MLGFGDSSCRGGVASLFAFRQHLPSAFFRNLHIFLGGVYALLADKEKVAASPRRPFFIGFSSLSASPLQAGLVRGYRTYINLQFLRKKKSL